MGFLNGYQILAGVLFLLLGFVVLWSAACCRVFYRSAQALYDDYELSGSGPGRKVSVFGILSVVVWALVFLSMVGWLSPIYIFVMPMVSWALYKYAYPELDISIHKGFWDGLDLIIIPVCIFGILAFMFKIPVWFAV